MFYSTYAVDTTLHKYLFGTNVSTGHTIDTNEYILTYKNIKLVLLNVIQFYLLVALL